MSTLTITHNGTTYTEDKNVIGLNFKDGIIDFVKVRQNDENYILLISSESHLIIKSNNARYLPSESFLKAVKSCEFNCSFTLLNDILYAIN